MELFDNVAVLFRNLQASPCRIILDDEIVVERLDYREGIEIETRRGQHRIRIQKHGITKMAADKNMTLFGKCSVTLKAGFFEDIYLRYEQM